MRKVLGDGKLPLDEMKPLRYLIASAGSGDVYHWHWGKLGYHYLYWFYYGAFRGFC